MRVDESRCEVCGRFPAKQMTFRGHTGYVLARRVTTISGVFCRDCAIEAYAHTRGISLKGMWFGTASLLAGTAGALWDSIKLLDLPPAVKDAPWMPHRIACPHCSAAMLACAGQSECSECSRQLVVSSCTNCGTISVSPPRADQIPSGLQCKSCSYYSEPPLPSRNSPKILFGRGIVEIALAMRDAGHPVAIRDWLAPYWSLHEVGITTCEWLETIYRDSAHETDRPVLEASAEADQHPFLQRLLGFALALSRDEQVQVLLAIASRYGYARQDIEIPGTAGESGGDDSWAKVLGLRAGASSAEIHNAYRRLALQYHPDRRSGQDGTDRAARMKEINAAYEQACRHVESGGRDPGPSSQWREFVHESRKNYAVAVRNERARRSNRERDTATTGEKSDHRPKSYTDAKEESSVARHGPAQFSEPQQMSPVAFCAALGLVLLAVFAVSAGLITGEQRRSSHAVAKSRENVSEPTNPDLLVETPPKLSETPPKHSAPTTVDSGGMYRPLPPIATRRAHETESQEGGAAILPETMLEPEPEHLAFNSTLDISILEAQLEPNSGRRLAPSELLLLFPGAKGKTLALLDEGFRRLHSGNTSAAEISFSTIVNQSPSFAAAYLLSAVASALNGDWEAATQGHLDAMRLNDRLTYVQNYDLAAAHKTKSAALYRRAQEHLSAGRVHDAEDAMESSRFAAELCLLTCPESAVGHLAVAEYWDRLGRTGLAMEHRMAARNLVHYDTIRLEKRRKNAESSMHRLWTSISGRFSVNATYLKSSAQSVWLEKENGKTISVPLSKLSIADRVWIGMVSQ